MADTLYFWLDKREEVFQTKFQKRKSKFSKKLQIYQVYKTAFSLYVIWAHHDYK